MDGPLIRVLLVDDDEDDFILARDLLAEISGSQFRIEWVSDYDDALEAIGQERHDVYLLDYRLGSRNGLELLRKAVDTGCQAPFILLTGQGDREIDLEAMKAGAADYLMKGQIDASLLERSIRYAIERHRDQQALRQARNDLEKRVQERTADLEKANEALRTIDERFRLIMECVKEYAIFMLDPEGRVVDWNAGAEHLLGYRQEEIIGQPFATFFTAEEGRCGVPEQELKTAADVGQASDERWHIRKDSTHFWATGITTALRNGKGSLRGFAKVMRDNTERKRLDEELQHRADALVDADRRKDEFLAMLAHELRNPLAPIFTAMHILESASAHESIQQQARGVIERQMRQLARLVDDLLDVSRITRGKIKLSKTQVELKVVIDHAIQTTAHLLESHGHALSVSIPPEPTWLDADATRLEQVLANLLNNAAKYTPDGGRISVTASREASQIMLRVQDTGIGIPADMLPGVFDLFSQADRSLDRSEGGLGIGLTVAKRLVEMHSGTIEVFSAGLGKGSEFTVRLPLLVELPAESAEDYPEAAQHNERPLHVLVVEDITDAAEMLSLLLKLAGHAVQVAHCGLTALQVAEAWRPDVILLDIGLPGLNGYQVAQRLREQPALKSVVLIAMTGYGQEADRQRAKEVGFDFHLVKPVEPQKLRELMTLLVDQKRADLTSSQPA